MINVSVLNVVNDLNFSVNCICQNPDSQSKMLKMFNPLVWLTKTSFHGNKCPSN